MSSLEEIWSFEECTIEDYSNVECGLVHLEHERPVPIPLRHVDVRATMIGFAAEVFVKQKFENTEEVPVEVRYLFPMVDSAAVIQFDVMLDGRKIQSRVKEKGDARYEYDEAMEEGKTAFLLHHTKPDMFHIKLGRLRPGAEVTIEICYICELPIVGNDRIKLTIPTTIAPRPVRKDDPKEIRNLQHSLKTPAPMTIDITIKMATKIAGISSASHAIDTQILPDELQAKVKLAHRTTDMNREFLLEIHVPDIHNPQVFLEISPDGSSSAAVVSYVPKRSEIQTAKKFEFILILDFSDNNEEHSVLFEQSTFAQVLTNTVMDMMTAFLDAIDQSSFVNVFFRSASGRSLFKNSRPISEVTDEHFDNVVSKSYRSTIDQHFLHETLRRIYTGPSASPDHEKLIFLLSSGSNVIEGEELCHFVSTNSLKGRLFTFGIGSAPNRNLLNKLATAGGGTAEYAAQQNEVPQKILNQLRMARNPALKDLNFKWVGVKNEGLFEVTTKKTLFGSVKGRHNKRMNPAERTWQTPEVLPPIYPGQRLLLYCLFTKDIPTTLKLIGKTPSNDVVHDISVDESHRVSGLFIHKLAVQSKIKELETMGKDFVGKIVQRLACQYQMLSSQTSFVAVDHDHMEHEARILSPLKKSISHQYPSVETDGTAISTVDESVHMVDAVCIVSEMYIAPRISTIKQPQGHRPPAADLPSNVNTVHNRAVSLLCRTHVVEQPSGTIERLVMEQSRNGAFDWSEAVESLLGRNLEDLSRDCPTNFDMTSWITALVIVKMEANSGAPLVANANAFLQESHGKQGKEELLKAAQAELTESESERAGSEWAGPEWTGWAGPEWAGSEWAGYESAGPKSDGSESDGSKSDGSKSDGSKSDGSESDGFESVGFESAGSELDGSESDGFESAGSESDGFESDGAESDGFESA